jgi:hypothetical protein
MNAMKCAVSLLVVLAGAAGLPGIAAEPAANSSLDSLINSSPFGQVANAPAAVQANPLELRGVFVDKGETYFSLYEVSSRISRWVTVNETGNPFVVKGYDQTKGIARIEYQGREISLGLKQAKVVAMAAPTPAPNQPGPAPGQPVASPANPGAQPDEAARLAAIAEEIRRRRALRQQSVTSLPTATPPPAPSPK